MTEVRYCRVNLITGHITPPINSEITQSLTILFKVLQ